MIFLVTFYFLLIKPTIGLNLVPFQVKALVTSARKYCQMIVTLNGQNETQFIEIFWKMDTKKKIWLEKWNQFQFCSQKPVCIIDCHWFVSYIFLVKVSQNGVIHYHGNWTFKANQDIYKLDKLKKVNIINQNSQSLEISYKITNKNDQIIVAAADLCFYKILFTSEWDSTPKYLITNKTKVVLNNLVPYTMYRIEVQAKINQSFYWSEKSILQKRTLSSAPFKGPQSTNGSYLETTCKDESKRCFFLFWEMIPMPLRNGILDAYIIRQNGRLLLENSEIFASIKNQPRNKDLWFEIQAKNNNSLYSPKTIIHIPPIAFQKLKEIFIVQMNKTFFNISWAIPQTLTETFTVTVVSCLGDEIDTYSWCKSNLMWTKTENKTFLVLKAEKGTNFAVYVSNSSCSSSLTLPKCIFIQGKPIQPPRPIILKKYPSSVDLLWPNLNCADLKGRPTLFQILYKKGRNECLKGSAINIEAIGIKPVNEKITLKNLKPFQNYSICLRIKNQNGWSKMSRQFHIETLESNPGNSVRNLHIFNIKQTLVTLRWEPTLEPNGIIIYHVIYYYKTDSKETKYISSDASNMATVSNLIPATKYSFAVSTCNKAGCSLKSSYLTDKTLEEEKEIFFVIILPIILVSIIMIFLICFGRYLYKKYQKLMSFDVKVPHVISENSIPNIIMNDRTELKENGNIKNKQKKEVSNVYYKISCNSRKNSEIVCFINSN